MIHKQTFFKRTGVPVLCVLLCWIGFHWIHFTDWHFSNGSVRLTVANLSAVLLFVSIGLGPSFVYPYAYLRGAGLLERIAGAFVTPGLWTLKEAYRVSEFFTIPEVLYYIVNSLFLVLYVYFIGQCGIWEMVCRRRLNRSESTRLNVVTPIPVLSILLMLAGTYVFFLWGLGVHFTYIYIDGYKALFQ